METSTNTNRGPVAATELNRLLQLALMSPEVWDRVAKLDPSLLSQYHLTEPERRALETADPADLAGAGAHPTLGVYLMYIRKPEFAQAMSAAGYLDDAVWGDEREGR
jgi:hypothetical protein